MGKVKSKGVWESVSRIWGNKGNGCVSVYTKTRHPQKQKSHLSQDSGSIQTRKINNPYRTRITAGGDQLDYDGETSTNSASMSTIKIHQNSVLSTPNAKYTTADAGNMYLASMLREPQYLRFKLS